MSSLRRAAIAIVAVALTGCAGSSPARRTSPAPDPFAGLPADVRPVPAGRGPRFQPPAVSPAVAARRPVAGLPCEPTATGRRPYAVHLELYARGLVLPVPAGIGIAPPQRREGAYVRGGACLYPLRTLEPTGLVLVATGGRAPRLGTLFAIWGQPLSRSALASFRGPVRAYLGGRAWPGSPAAIPLIRHAEIVLEVGGYVPPHPRYRFPPGL